MRMMTKESIDPLRVPICSSAPRSNKQQEGGSGKEQGVFWGMDEARPAFYRIDEMPFNVKTKPYKLLIISGVIAITVDTVDDGRAPQNEQTSQKGSMYTAYALNMFSGTRE